MSLFDPDTWQELGDALRAAPLRTALTMAGVFWGTLVLLLMLGFSSGLEQATAQTVRGMAKNAVFIWGGRTRLPYEGMQPGRWVRYDNDDIPVIAAMPGVRHLAPRNQLGGHRAGATVVRDGEAGSFTVIGDTPEVRHILTVQWDAGRFLNELDLQDGRKVAVIGREVHRTLFPDGSDPIGEWIRIQGVHFQVVGLYHSERADDQGDRDEQTVHVPFTTFQRAFNSGDQVQYFAVVAEDDADASDLEAQIKAVLTDRHGVHPSDSQALGSYNAEQEFRRIQSLFSGIRGLTWLVGIATLLTGAVGVSNVMLIVVRERTKEIGLRRALGATPSAIVSLILQEAVLITSVAGITGLLVGVGILQVAAFLVGPDNPSFGQPRVDPGAAVGAAVVLVLAGVLAGALPARRAVSIQPVEALRAE